MKVMRLLFTRSTKKLLRNPSLWLIVALLALITIPHYGETLAHPAFLTRLTANLGLERHAFERILYLAPIVWASLLFGWKGGFITSLVAIALMLPRAIFFSIFHIDAIFETSAVFIIGNVLAISFNALRNERERRVYLDALNRTSNVACQTLDLDQLLNSSLETVMAVMKVDAAMVFLLDEAAGELKLTAHRGVSDDFVKGVDNLRLGEGFNGMVAVSGEPLFVEDASKDSRLSRDVVKESEIHSEIIVPLGSKEKVIGTLCAAMRRQRQFQKDEIELLSAIGNQIGVAAENARLYQQQQNIAYELRVSEERYRELFENAHDAIWLHDMEGKIITANKAAAILTGYSIEELLTMNVKSFLPEESLGLAGQIRKKLLGNEPVEQPYEQRLTRKDGTEAFVQLTTSVVFEKGKPTAFQHIARDITEQKRVQENIRFYAQQAIRGQEEERKRISREIHDDAIQALVVHARQLDALASNTKELPEKDRLRLEELWREVNEIMQGLRRLSQDLRPPVLERLGLLPALEALVTDVAKYSGIKTTLRTIGNQRRLSEEAELLLFRIVKRH
ncbi:MAG: PAS domain S-box protein [Chloroflexota bacterium]